MNTKQGQILLIVALMLTTILTVVMAVTFKSTNESRTTKIEEESQKALAAAEAALESALQTNQNVTLGLGQLSSFTGITGDATIEPLITNIFTTSAIPKEGSYTFYLVDYDPVTKSLNGTSLDQDLTVCFESATPNPAIEITLIKAESVRKYVVDPDRRISNTYQPSETCPVDSTFDFSYKIPGSEIINDSKLLLVRVMYSPSKLLLTRDSNLPIQGRIARASTITKSGVSKKVTLFQSYPQIPSEFFVTTF